MSTFTLELQYFLNAFSILSGLDFSSSGNPSAKVLRALIQTKNKHDEELDLNSFDGFTFTILFIDFLRMNR